MDEGLAASEILNKSDPALLTSKEIKAGWGSNRNFFYSYGLKPWNSEDCEMARQISRTLKESNIEEARQQEQQGKSGRQH
jgi:hypothetical protein